MEGRGWRQEARRKVEKKQKRRSEGAEDRVNRAKARRSVTVCACVLFKHHAERRRCWLVDFESFITISNYLSMTL